MENTPDNPDASQRVVVAHIHQQMEAAFLQSLLDADGIACELEGDLTITANPMLSNAIGGIRLVVTKLDAEKAAEIIADYNRNKIDEDARRAATCPECGHVGSEEVRRPAILSVLIVLTLGFFSLLFKWPRYRCPACGHKWT